MDGQEHCVYCAGPLFNEKEREEMHLIATSLENAGYMTFLPQRDGLELIECIDELVKMGVAAREATQLMSRAIFALDVFMVLRRCHVTVANLNGRVPDEGTVSEASMAWSRGKAVVGYKADARTTFAGQDNPLVAGLFGFQFCGTIEEIPCAVESVLKRSTSRQGQREVREFEIGAHEEFGEEIWAVIQKTRSPKDVLDLVVKHQSSVIGSSECKARHAAGDHCNASGKRMSQNHARTS